MTSLSLMDSQDPIHPKSPLIYGGNIFETFPKTHMTQPSSMEQMLPQVGQLGLEPYHSSSRSSMGWTHTPGWEHSGQGAMGQSCLEA